MQWYRRLIGVFAFALLVWWLPGPSVAQDLGYMEQDGWVFDVPETAGMGPDGGYVASDYEAAIYDACARHGCDGAWLVDVMYCESGGDHGVVGPNGERGIFQFHPNGQWPDAAWLGPYDQIELAAQLFAQGYSYAWVCA